MKNYKFVNSTGLTNYDLKGHHPEGTTPDEKNKMTVLRMHNTRYYQQTAEQHGEE